MRTRTSTRSTSLALAVAGLGVLAATSACSGLGRNDSGSTSRTSATAAGTSSGTTAVVPRDPALDSSTAIASRQATFEEATVRFDLLSLRRTGNLATLRFTATNTTPGTVDDIDKEWTISDDLGSSTSEYSVDGVFLVDPAHAKKYPTATDSADDCVCSSTEGVDIRPTQSREFSATFAAPPPEVAAVDVYVPGAGTIENVPVS